MRSTTRAILISVAASWLLGCTTERTPTSTNRPSFEVTQDPSVDPLPTPAGPTLDETFLAVEREVPGFAGVFVDKAGALVIQLVDTLQANAATSVVNRVFGGVPGLRGRVQQIASVRYSFSRLWGWREALYKAGLPAGVRFVDLDEQANLIRVGTAEESGAVSVTTQAIGLGIPKEAIRAEAVPASVQLIDYLTGRIRPVKGGVIVITSYAGCTLGFKAKKTGTTRYFTINSHCTHTFGQVDSDQVGQPLLQSNYYVGTEVSDPAFISGGTCPSGYSCRFADAALVQCDTISACSQYQIAQTTFEYTGSDTTQSGSYELTAEPWWVIGELSDASLVYGTTLSKVGQSSGWTGAGRGDREKWSNRRLRVRHSTP